MSSFTKAELEPVIDPATGKQKRRAGRPVYRVAKDFYWELGFKGSGLRIYARKGYETDGPSRPTLASPGLFNKLAAVLLAVVPQRVWELAVPGSVIHDILREDLRFSLDEGNAVFWLCLEAVGMDGFWRDRLFDAVRSNTSRKRHNAEDLISGSVDPGCGVTELG